MAMIKCPECGKEISDKTKKCVNCGCPIKKKVNKKIIEIIVIVIVLTVAIAGITYKTISDRKEKERQEEIERDLADKADKERIKKEYKENVVLIISKIYTGATEAEDIGDLTYSVWYNSIWEEKDSKTDKYTMKNGKFNKDFNTSLQNLFNDSEYIKKVSNVKSTQNEVGELMKKLRTPPAGYEETYKLINDVYDSYLTFTNLAINPTGNLTSFSSNYNNAKSDFINQYSKTDTIDY